VSSSKGPELRIGLVLYGGVSLAVYIYGVVAEVQRLLMAGREVEYGVPAEEMSPYARALDQAGISKVSVDLLSGTSAGGINGVLLAKSLACGSDVLSARNVWIEGGDIEQLLQPPSISDPRSLLRSRYFEDQLERGLRMLGRKSDKAPPRPQILDLFVSSTHLRGARRLFVDSLGTEISTRQHRFVFQLKIRRERAHRHGPATGYHAEDFEDDGRLVKLCRATSAFPGAFEPVLIEGSDGLLPEGTGDGWFADGGILNNKPFTEAVETIVNRGSDRPVKRWLFSVDPDPKLVPREKDAGPQPAFDQIAVSAIAAIPRYQSIARDLIALETHNERVAAAADLVRVLETSGLDDRAWAGDLPDGGGYELLRRQAWGLEIADLMLGAVRAVPAGLDLSAVHRTLRQSAEALAPPIRSDLTFKRRQIYYAIKLLSIADEVEGDSDSLREALWDRCFRIESVLWDLFGRATVSLSPEAWKVDLEAVVRQRIWSDVEDLARAFDEADEFLLDPLRSVEVGFRLEPAGRARFDTVLRSYLGFARRDGVLLTGEVYGSLRSRDRVEHAQISPIAAANTEVPAEGRLAGATLGHFGGFLDRGWRRNDLMWGRLDGAEILMKAIAGTGGDAPGFLDEAQIEIVRDEMPELGIGPLDWRAKLRAYVEGDRSVGELNGRRVTSIGLRAAAIVRGMLSTAAAEAADSGLVGRARAVVLKRIADALGFVLALVYLPATALFAKGHLLRRAAILAAFLPFLWGLATLVLGILGVLELDDVAGPAAIGILIYPGFLIVYWSLAWLARKLGRIFKGL
jgi:predicted acylesterase/phospholipase RssA